jgi:hypothetical protein
MSFTVLTSSGPEQVDATEHRLEGLHHVFRTTTTVMGRPRTMVVRRLPAATVLSVTPYQA